MGQVAPMGLPRAGILEREHRLVKAGRAATTDIELAGEQFERRILAGIAGHHGLVHGLDPVDARQRDIHAQADRQHVVEETHDPVEFGRAPPAHRHADRRHRIAQPLRHHRGVDRQHGDAQGRAGALGHIPQRCDAGVVEVHPFGRTAPGGGLQSGEITLGFHQRRALRELFLPIRNLVLQLLALQPVVVPLSVVAVGDRQCRQ